MKTLAEEMQHEVDRQHAARGYSDFRRHDYMMSDHRFGQIRAQLSLYDAMDPDHIDLGVAREAFADCRRLLREFVDGAQLVGRGQEDTADAPRGGDSDHTSCLETIGKQAETIAAQADQIVSLSKTTTELTLAVLKK